jgi:hypothetical protein
MSYLLEAFNGKLRKCIALTDLIYNVEFEGSAPGKMQMQISRFFHQPRNLFWWIGLLYKADWAMPQGSPISSTSPNSFLWLMGPLKAWESNGITDF